MSQLKKREALFLLLVFLGAATACLFLPGRVLAQSALATLEGKVTDDTGAPLPGASVSLKNTGTGYVLSSLTRSDGAYTVSGIQAGSYEITVSLSGFTTQIRQGISFAVGAKLNLDFSLTPATVTAEVTVVGEAPMIEVTKSEISTVIEREKIEALPLLNRDFSDLTVIKAGVLEGVSNAQPVGSGEMVVDGISNESVSSNTLGTVLPADAIQEFRVITTQATAEFGNMSGLVTTAITRSGTNDLRGRLAFFYRDEGFGSVNYFVNHAQYGGAELPEGEWEESPYSRTDVNGFLGGPIIKDKAHFFLSFSRVDAKQYATITSPLVEHQSVAQKSWATIVLAKFSYQLNKNNQFSLRLNIAPSYASNQNVGGFYTLEQGFTAKEQPFAAVAEWTWFASANTMNELRLNLSLSQFQYPANAGVD
jgi:hypothetical protein